MLYAMPALEEARNVAQAFRLEVCSCCGVVTVGAKTLTPGIGELQNSLAHLAVGSCEVRLWEARD